MFPEFVCNVSPTEFPSAAMRFLKSLSKDFFRELNYTFSYLKEKGGYVPDNVFAASDWVRAFAKTWFKDSNKEFLDSFDETSFAIAACVNWYTTQDIVQFDGDIYEELCNTSIQNVPYEILLHLPSYGVWAISPGLVVGDTEMFGFFAYYDFDYKRKFPCIKIVTFSHDGDDACLYIPLLPNTYIPQDYEDAKPMQIITNLLLYICSYGYGDSVNYKSRNVSYVKPKKTKKGWRFYPPNKPSIWTLGVTFGKIIRESKFEKQQVTNGVRHVSPHIRRAHWHSFWTGERNSDKRKLVAKWLPPCVVNGQSCDPEETVTNF